MKTSNVMMILMIFLLGIMTVNNANAVLTDNLLAYYTMDEVSGNAIDSLGIYNLTESGTVNSCSGIIGNSRCQFDNNYLDTNLFISSFRIINDTTPITMNEWVSFEELPSSYSVPLRIGGLTDGADYIINLIYEAGATRFVCNIQKAGVGGIAYEYVVTPTLNTWYNLQCTYDGAGNVVFLVNGNAGSSIEANTPTATTPYSELKIGSADARRYNGSVDEIGIWDRVLNSTELSALYNSGAGLSYPFSEPESCAVCNETCSPCGGGCTATDLTSMYTGVSGFDATYGNISGWDTSCITDLFNTFSHSDFNQDINGWNTSNVISLSVTFYNTSYNRPLNNWDTSKVKQMGSTFGENYVFNQPLNNWDTSSVDTNTGFGWMFGSEFGNGVFNQDISMWNTSNIKTMDGMFLNNPSFNQNIGLWNTSNVTSMYDMFNNATSFEQDISLWDVSQVTDMTGMLENVNLTTVNYDALLVGWSAQTVQSSVVFNAGFSQYCNQTARDILTGTYGWTITDGGYYNCTTPTPTPPQPNDITGAVTQVNNGIVSILVALIILAVIIGIIGLLLTHFGMMSKNVLMIMGAVLVALVLIILVLSFQMIGVV